jgi:hypothetical protein
VGPKVHAYDWQDLSCTWHGMGTWNDSRDIQIHLVSLCMRNNMTHLNILHNNHHTDPIPIPHPSSEIVLAGPSNQGQAKTPLTLYIEGSLDLDADINSPCDT